MPLVRCVDEVEGTARGAWLLTRWQQDFSITRYVEVPCELSPETVRGLHAAWQQWAAQVRRMDGRDKQVQRVDEL